MHLHHNADCGNKYIWKCPQCYTNCSIQTSSIMNGVNIRHLDIALTLWMMNCKTLAAAKMLHSKSRNVTSTSDKFFVLFRKAHSHYAEKKILPYLVLDGPIEIDESKVNHKKFHCRGSSFIIRWMFGMYCRQTKIQVIYCIKDKSMGTLVPLMKKHCMQGTTIFSDQHMSYCNMNKGTSNLAPYGFYHMWTNHSYRMVHEKFPFN